MQSEIRARTITIPRAVRDQLVDHALAGLPNEACGLLAGPGGKLERFFPMTNADRSPMTFRLDPKEQFRVFREIDELGWVLGGIFHTHTHTEAYPSATDRAQAFYPEAFHLLVSLADRDRPVLRAFIIIDGEVEEQELRIG
jgi:[CysO sulfur-carrier protein]-S-L-cysteine hydrolase